MHRILLVLVNIEFRTLIQVCWYMLYSDMAARAYSDFHRLHHCVTVRKVTKNVDLFVLVKTLAFQKVTVQYNTVRCI